MSYCWDSALVECKYLSNFNDVGHLDLTCPSGEHVEEDSCPRGNMEVAGTLKTEPDPASSPLTFEGPQWGEHNEKGTQ